MLIDNIVIEKEDNKCFIYINGKRVDVEETNFFQILNNNMDKEFNSEIIDLLEKMPQKIMRQSVRVETRIELYLNSINEINKTVYGIQIGKTNRTEAFHIIKNILKTGSNFDKSAQYVHFQELGMALYFNTDNDTVEEIILSNPFEGSTTQGLKIGQSMENAYKLCGEPKIRSIVTAFWNNFSVYIKNEIITSIRLY